MLVGHDLQLDVARLLHVALEVHRAVAEGGQRLGRGGVEGLADLGAPRGQIFMPRPPPPAAALRMTGKPISLGQLLAPRRPSRSTPRAPGRSGSPAFSMASRAATLLPMSRSISGRGPMKRSRSFSTISANSAFSERKPYPGWMASAPVSSAAASTARAFR